jgi:cyclophilin family peptidyl-prolyl cis-trans isomerase/protein-disulfide isomerase
MNKRVITIFVLWIGLFTGCQGYSPSSDGAKTTTQNLPEATNTLPGSTSSQATDTTPAGCTVISPDPTPGPTEESMFPPVTEKDWSIGPANATVTILEYGDYQCPGCAGVAPVMLKILKEYPQDIRLVYRHFPLIGMHDKAAITTQVAEAAGLQGKFWEMHAFLFAQQDEWVGMSVDQFKEWIVGKSESLGLEQEKFKKDMLSDEIAAIPQTAWDTGYSTGMPGTPFILINDEIFSNNFPLSEGNLMAIVKLHLLEKRQFTSCPPMAIDKNKKYTAIIHTEKGDIVINLFARQAPIAVNNFIFLAKNGWYDNIIFHRVIAGFVAQAGDPSGTGYGSPGYAFVNEISDDLTFDRAGLVAMANAGPGTNGSQFFITFAPVPDLNGKYTIFGEVISGMEIAQKLTPRDTQQDLGQVGDKILNVTIEEQ